MAIRYFVWFRIDDQQLQFYKVINDTFYLKSTINNITTNLNQMYDFKVTYDRITGRIAVWRNDVFLGSWTDPTPYSTNGNYISFRTGNCIMNVTELKVYRSRYPQVTVTLGNSTKDIRYQNPNPNTPAAKIKSIVVDSNNNLSQIAYHDLNIDWTPPHVFNINDGMSNDVDTIYSVNTVYANYQQAVDPNSDIQEYFYSIGTLPGLSDVVSWTSAGLSTSIEVNNLNLTLGQTYYFNLKAVNGAGLESEVISSDGFVAMAYNLPVAHFYAIEDTLYLPNAIALFVNQSSNATSYLWDFGDNTTSTQVNPWHQYNQAGSYTVKLIAMNPPLPNDTMTIVNCITVLNSSKISEQYYYNIKLLPNPFKNELSIMFSDVFSGKVFIQDVCGKTIFESMINKETVMVISTEKLATGLYLIKIVNEKDKPIYLQKVVKE